MSSTLAVNAAIALALALTIGWCFAGPAPRRRRAPALQAALLAIGCGCYLAALAAFALGRAGWTGYGVALASELLCLAAWLGRTAPPDDPAGEEAPAAPPPGQDADWDRFERAFRDYARRRSPSRPRVPA
jgi:hypothetical protein